MKEGNLYLWLTLDGLIAKVVLEWDLTGFYTQPT